MRVRSAPSTHSDCLANLRTGDRVTALEREGNWIRHSQGWSLLQSDAGVFLEPVKVEAAPSADSNKAPGIQSAPTIDLSMKLPSDATGGSNSFSSDSPNNSALEDRSQAREYVIKSGYLRKTSRVVHRWQKRFFQLTNLNLRYFESESQLNEVRGEIPLLGAVVEISADDTKLIRLRPLRGQRCFEFKAETDAEALVWCSAIHGLYPPFFWIFEDTLTLSAQLTHSFPILQILRTLLRSAWMRS